MSDELTFKGPYMNGRFCAIKAKHFHHKLDPGNTERCIGQWHATPDCVDEAVDSAARAFSDWAWLKEKKRMEYLLRFRRLLDEHSEVLADLISSETGKPISESRAEVESALSKIDFTLKEGLRIIHPRQHAKTEGHYKYHPRGVLAIIGPFNFPLHLPNAQLVPALLTGNTVVFKPSELTPFTGQMIAELFHKAGFPKGVVNVVYGGAEVGRQMIEHHDVRGVLFVGSDATGRKVLDQTHRELNKICVLEMGGKNAAVIFPDANLKHAVEACVESALTTTGQRCNSLSRVIVHESLVNEFLSQLVQASLHWPIGYYQNVASRMGPLISAEAYKRFYQYQRRAKREGAHVVLAPHQYKAEYPGYYVTPSIHRFDEVEPKHTKNGYRYDEIFAPDVAVYTFRRTEEAIGLHNDSRYGLVASVFTQKKKIFEEMYRYLEVGNLHWNRPTIGSLAQLPFGGVKNSGNDFPAGVLSPLYCTYPVSIRM